MKERTLRNWDLALIPCTILAAGTFVFLALKNSAPILFLTALCAVIAAFAVYAPKKALAVADFCFRYRWAIALLIFILCLVFQISGSSIGVYDEIFPTQIDSTESTWFGKPRWIRSDEYGVQTPKFFSQAYNDHALYSNRMSLSPTNMVLDYYSPVWDLTALGKPLMWGYLLFGNTVGLSWYWCGMIILIFMTALEMIRILTGDCRWISVVGAVMITLSPAIQWWVMPHMPIVILYAMALFCVGYYFFTAKKTYSKWIFAALAVVTVLGFALSIFPAFQVPCTYAVIALLAVCLWRDRAKITFRSKEWYRIAIPVVSVLGILLYFVIVSKEDFSLLLNTAYPGERMDCGGANSIRDLFTDLTSLFLPYKAITYANNCEVSTYIHFAPLFLVLFPRIFAFLKRRHSADLWVGTTLAILLVIYGFYMVVGIPSFLAKLTFLKYCNRMKGVYGWLATLYTVWGICVLAKYPDLLKRWQKISYPIIYGAACVLLLDGNAIGYFESFGVIGGTQIGTVLLAGEIILFTALLLTVFFDRRRLSVCGLVVVMVVSGAFVNPVEHGTGAITNHPISRSISEISAEDPDGLWLCTDCTFFMPNFAMANGARILDATNFYPDVDKWNIIDPDSVYNEFTNRYANQSACIADTDKPMFELVSPDHIHYALPPETLQVLGIRYLLSAVDYTELLNAHGIQCILEFSQDGYGIYRLIY